MVAALHGVHIAGHRLLKLPEIAQQIGPAEFVVKGRATQGALGHDLQRACNVLGLAPCLVGHAAPELGDSKAGQTSLGLGAAACGTFVTDFTARSGGGARERRDGCGVVVRLHLHQDMVYFATLLIASCAYPTRARA